MQKLSMIASPLSVYGSIQFNLVEEFDEKEAGVAVFYGWLV